MRSGSGFQLPVGETRKIASRAVEIAKMNGPKSKWHSRHGVDRIKPISSPGKFGMSVPASASHLVYQDEGIRSFVMKGLKGKVIPIRDKDGTIHFRYAKAPGTARRIVARDDKGRITRQENAMPGRFGPGSVTSWQHPGLSGSHWIEKAMDQAFKEWAAGLDQDTAGKLLIQAGLHIKAKGS